MVALRSSAQASSSSSSNIAVAEPAGAAVGDWLVVAVAGNNVATLTDNNGSTPFARTYQGQESTSASTLAIFTRRKVAGDPSTLRFRSTSTSRISAISMAFSGGDAVAYDIAPSNSTDLITTGLTNTTTSIDITTTLADTIHICVAMIDAGSLSFNVFPSGYTAVQTVNAGQRVSAYILAMPTAGSTGAQNWGTTSGAYWITQSFAIRSVSASGGTAALTGQGITGSIGNTVPSHLLSVSGVDI